MPLDVLSSCLHTAQPLCPVLNQQLLNKSFFWLFGFFLNLFCKKMFLLWSYLDQESLYKVLGRHLDMARPLQFAREDLLIDPKWVVVVERWIT